MASPKILPLKSLFACAILAASLAGCELAGLVGGSGTQDALYKFEKNKRVVVLVDIDSTLTPPPTFAVNLADKIGAHLIRYKATDNLVSQTSVFDLQQRDPARFKAMSLADVARALGADVVLSVRVAKMDIETSEEKATNWGLAEAYVKVVDRNGTRLYPGDLLGKEITATVPTGLTSDHDTPAVQAKLLEQLALLTGRMFHPYNLDDKDMLQSGTDRKVLGP